MDLTIDLQDGFDDDTIVLDVDGKEVLRAEHVNTITQISFATSHTVSISKGRHAITVRLPEKNISKEFDTTLEQSIYLGVSHFPDQGLIFRIQNEPFGYL